MASSIRKQNMNIFGIRFNISTVLFPAKRDHKTFALQDDTNEIHA